VSSTSKKVTKNTDAPSQDGVFSVVEEPVLVAKKRTMPASVTKGKSKATSKSTVGKKTVTRATKKTSASKKPTYAASIFAPRRPVVHTDILMSVDVERKGLAAVSKYAGLFFVFVGLAVSSVSLSGIYVEGVELSLKTVSGTVQSTEQSADTIAALLAVENPPEAESDDPREGFSDVAIVEDEPGKATISIIAHNAVSVSYFTKTQNIVTERYLGKATEASSTEWSLTIDALSLPTNEYEVFAKITTAHGSYVSPGAALSILHEFTVASSTPNEQFDALTKSLEIAALEYDSRDPRKGIFAEIRSLPKPGAESSDVEVEQVSTDTSSSSTSTPVVVKVAERASSIDGATLASIDGVALEYEEEFGALITELSYATHVQNAYGIEDVKARMLALGTYSKNVLLTVLGSYPDTYASGYVAAFSDRYNLLSIESVEREVKKQNFTYEKVGGENFVDSDSDKLSDYDEYMLNTSPASADTDRDGFTDYFEIAGRSNPLDPENTKLTVNPSLDSAKEFAELFESSVTFTKGDIGEGGVDASTLSGTAPSDSYVTLYFASVPLIAWVKADGAGAWTYPLSNLDIEMGQHEVMVGLIDSAGSIKALSTPLKFAKTDRGFSSFRPLFHSSGMELVPISSFSENLLLLGYALTVLILGSCLMLLGLHLSYHSLRSNPKSVSS